MIKFIKITVAIIFSIFALSQLSIQYSNYNAYQSLSVPVEITPEMKGLFDNLYLLNRERHINNVLLHGCWITKLSNFSTKEIRFDMTRGVVWINFKSILGPSLFPLSFSAFFNLHGSMIHYTRVSGVLGVMHPLGFLIVSVEPEKLKLRNLLGPEIDEYSRVANCPLKV